MNDDRPRAVLCLGAGIQSTTTLLMSCQSLLPRLDCAIFADTGWEPQSVYENLAWLTEQAKNVGIPVHRVTCGRNIRDDAMTSQVRGKVADGPRWASMPLRVLNVDGSRGMIRRQCTREYKIAPIERFIRRTLLRLNRGQRAPRDAVEQWFGISADEVRRVRMSDQRWKRHIYPLCNLPDPLLDRPYTRLMCERWLAEHYPGRVFPRSACIGCPFRSDLDWRRLRDTAPREWSEAVMVDRAIRRCGGMRGEMYLHRSCKPLSQADLGDNQTELWSQECLGICGV